MGNRAPRKDIEALSSWILDKIRAEGLCGDIMYSTSVSHAVSFRDGEPEEDAHGVVSGIGIRTISPDGRQGVAACSDMSREAVSDVIRWSAANCRASEPEDHIYLHDVPIDDDASSLDMYDEVIDRGFSRDHRVKVCDDMTRAARSIDDRIVSIRSSSWGDAVVESFYASTEGLSGWSLETLVSCGVTAIAGDNDEFEMSSFGLSETILSKLSPDRAARIAAETAVSQLGGAPVATGRWTLMFDPEMTAALADEIGSMFCASDVHRGRSMMAGKLGSQVASPLFELIDDARLRGRMGSKMFDSEGVATGRTVLISSGVAQNYLYDLHYAAKDGTRSTGNAVRHKTSLPDVAPSNLVVSPGKTTRDEMISKISRGLLIREVMGLHTIDSVTGEFSLGAKGLLIEGGKLGRPVAGITIAGRLTDLLKNITEVGSDLEFFGSTGAPSITVEDVAVAGR